MSSSIKHVRLSFGEEGIVFPVAQKTGPVSQLLAAATVRFRALRLLAADDSFIEITSGGYKINPTDNIEDVIENGEALTLVNRTAWVAKFRSQYKIDYWFSLASWDRKGKYNRKITVGYVASKAAVCVSLFQGDNCTKMEPFDRDTLTSYAKDGDILAMHNEGELEGGKYQESVYFVVKQGKATAIRLHLKASNDIQPQITEWPLTIPEDGAITYGDKVEVQSNWPAAPSKSYTVPQTVATGAHLELETPQAKRDYEEDLNESTGDSKLVFRQTSEVTPSKSAGGSSTWQSFKVGLLVLNNAERDTGIVSMKAEYKNAEGVWTAFTDCEGERGGYNGKDPMSIASREINKFVLRADIKLPEQKCLFNREPVIDASLPVPFEMRYIFTDQDGGKATLNMTCNKRGMTARTLEDMKKSYENIQKYWFVDNLVLRERFGAYLEVHPSDGPRIRIAPDSSVHYLSASNLHSHVESALEEKQDEYEIAKYSYGEYVGSIHLLVDLEQKYAYGCRVRLACTGASLDECFLLDPKHWL